MSLNLHHSITECLNQTTYRMKFIVLLTYHGQQMVKSLFRHSKILKVRFRILEYHLFHQMVKFSLHASDDFEKYLAPKTLFCDASFVFVLVNKVQ